MLSLLILATASACGKVKVSPTALDDFRTATRLSVPDTMELSDETVSRLAAQGSVDESVIREVAPNLDSQSTWKSSVTKLREIYAEVPEDVRSGTINVACDAIEGDISTTDEFAQALYNEFGPSDDTRIQQIVVSFVDYYQDMSVALAAGDERAAAVTLTCYIASESS